MDEGLLAMSASERERSAGQASVAWTARMALRGRLIEKMRLRGVCDIGRASLHPGVCGARMAAIVAVSSARPQGQPVSPQGRGQRGAPLPRYRRARVAPRYPPPAKPSPDQKGTFSCCRTRGHSHVALTSAGARLASRDV